MEAGCGEWNDPWHSISITCLSVVINCRSWICMVYATVKWWWHNKQHLNKYVPCDGKNCSVFFTDLQIPQCRSNILLKIYKSSGITFPSDVAWFCCVNCNILSVVNVISWCKIVALYLADISWNRYLFPSWCKTAGWETRCLLYLTDI